MSVYDTQVEEAHRVTFNPPNDLIHPSKERVLVWADSYLKSLSDPSHQEHVGLPMEFILADELSNPHSRAVKQKRWQQAMEARKVDRGPPKTDQPSD